MEGSQESQIEKFIELTNTTEDRAKFYLESSGWNLTVAVSTFLENDDSPAPENVPAASQPERRQEEKMDEEVSVSDTDEEFLAGGPSKSQKRSKKSYNLRNAGGARIATLRQSQSSDEEEEGQAFFVGGGERSGQQVIGPKKDKKKPEEIVADLFKSAREHGAEVVDPTSSRKERSSFFKGTGHKLGQTADDSEVIAGAPQKAKPKEVTLQLWKTGFSIDDGPLRLYDDPKNRLFLASVKQGEIPFELVREAKGGTVHLNMEDHRDIDFVPSRTRFAAFGGEGHMLGSPTPAMSGAGVSSKAASSVAPGPSSIADPKVLEANAAAAIGLDTAQPVANVQIRFVDGSRLVAKFNHSHTIGSVRQFIEVARPGVSVTDFALVGGVPAKEITDETSSLKDLGLLGSSLMVRNK